MLRGKARTPPSGASAERPAARSARFPIAGWMRWIAGTRATTLELAEPAGAAPSVCDRVRVLPGLLDGSILPNGVVELVVEDFEAPTRQLFDVQDGAVAVIEPGSAVPWVSIAGSAAAWASALGPERQLEALRLTGDQVLARRVVEAFPPGVVS